MLTSCTKNSPLINQYGRRYITTKPPISCHVELTCDYRLGPHNVISLLHALNILKKWELGEIVEDFDEEAY
jgi:hypothetical protein